MNSSTSIWSNEFDARQGGGRPCRIGMPARIGAGLMSCALAAALCSVPGERAFGIVLQDDEVLSQSVAQRALAESACPDIEARNALLVSRDGTVYFARSAHEPVKIASITKVMTAVVALENAPLDTKVTVDAEAAGVGESSAGLLEGDSMDLETALYALMVPSGNDAAVAIAKSVGALLPGYDGADPQAAFVAAMNAKAQELGCENTVYSNPHGLDAGAFESDSRSTAADVGIVVSYAMRNDVFRSVVDAGDTSIEVLSADGSSRFIQLVSTDELIGVYDGICGVKTGTTDAAGYCFAGAVSREEGEFYSVVLGSPEPDVRFADTVALFDWTYGNIVQKRLINSTERIEADGMRQPLVAKVAHTQWPDCTIDAVASDPDLAVEVFDLAGPIEQQVSFVDVKGDVSEGDVLGHLTFTQAGEKIAECDMVAAESQAAPDFFQEIGVRIDRFVRGLQNQPTMATSVCLNDPAAIADM